MKRNKKKGFTLVELIAVIAILAILAAVVVPKITSYTDSARSSSRKANANTILNMVEVYNAQASTQIQTTATLANIVAGKADSTQTAAALDSTNPGAKALTDLQDTIKKVTKDSAVDGDSSTTIGNNTTVANLQAMINATN